MDEDRGLARGRSATRGGRGRGRGFSVGFGRDAYRDMSIGAASRRRGFSVDATPRRRARLDLSSSISSTSASGPKALGARDLAVELTAERRHEWIQRELKSKHADCKSRFLQLMNRRPMKMGDPDVLVTEENCKASLEAKDRAMDAVLKGDLDSAIEHLDRAVLLNPTAVMYCARASVYLKKNLIIFAAQNANEDSFTFIDANYAKGYKFRGQAHLRFDHRLEAANDLRVASKLDFDEETTELLKQVEQNIPNRAQAQANQQEQSSSGPGGFPGAAGSISSGLLGAGGMPDGFQGSGVMPGDFPGSGGTAGGS